MNDVRYPEGDELARWIEINDRLARNIILQENARVWENYYVYRGAVQRPYEPQCALLIGNILAFLRLVYMRTTRGADYGIDDQITCLEKCMSNTQDLGYLVQIHKSYSIRNLREYPEIVPAELTLKSGSYGHWLRLDLARASYLEGYLASVIAAEVILRTSQLQMAYFTNELHQARTRETKSTANDANQNKDGNG